VDGNIPISHGKIEVRKSRRCSFLVSTDVARNEAP